MLGIENLQIGVAIALGCLVFVGQKAYESNWYLIWNWDLVPVATIFILLGVLTRRHLSEIEKYLTLKFLPIAAVISIVVGLLNYKLSGYRVDLYYQQIGNHLLFLYFCNCRYLGYNYFVQSDSRSRVV